MPKLTKVETSDKVAIDTTNPFRVPINLPLSVSLENPQADILSDTVGSIPAHINVSTPEGRTYRP